MYAARPRSGRDATHAGLGTSRRIPRPMPENATASTIDSGWISKRPSGGIRNQISRADAEQERRWRRRWPRSPVASNRNCRRISRCRAPTASRNPISRVRSVTETSMMFMIPMPPTASETPATAASRSASVRALASRVAAMSARLRIGEIVVLARLQAVALAQQRLRVFLRAAHAFAVAHLHIDRADGAGIGLVAAENTLTRGVERNEHDIVLVLSPGRLALHPP